MQTLVIEMIAMLFSLNSLSLLYAKIVSVPYCPIFKVVSIFMCIVNLHD